MKNMSALHGVVLGWLMAPMLLAAAEQVRATSASASSHRPGHPPSNAIDGNDTDASRWVSSESPPHWIDFSLPAETELSGLHLYSGFQGTMPLSDFKIQFLSEGTWRDIPSANVSGNRATRLALRFDDAVSVRTDRIRIFITATNDGIARVAEVIFWRHPGGVPPLESVDAHSAPTKVFLNQSGFNARAPKRFTAPFAKDGAEFQVRAAETDAILFRGKVQGNIGDFSDFEPRSSSEFVVTVDGDRSVPFRIGDWWLERVTNQRAIDFMIDARHHVGNDRRPANLSYAWRDNHHFGWELNTLVPQWLSNPAVYLAMPRQIVHEAPSNPALWGKLEPPHPDAPDIVKLMHWGADVIVTQQLTHEMQKAQLAYFLYAWPWIKNYLPEQNYKAVQEFAFGTWELAKADRQYPYEESPEHNLLALKTKLGSTKGGYPPGFSIQPNLLLHEVALREGRPDADRYLEAARAQAAWIVANLDWNNPQTTKGQRMSEFVTITSLCHLLSDYPQAAPEGLQEKLQDWARVAIRRSDNLWDFRKLGDAPDIWTPTGDRPTMWNEPGNVVGFPAIVFSLLPHIQDAAVANRLERIAWAHFDSMFGRNPTGRHFSYDAPRELEGVEHGWYSFHVGGVGRLEEARFVLDGSPKNQHFPFNPEVGNIGWTEGWVQHNTPFNLSLAYLARHSSSLTMRQEGREWIIRLEGPINLDPSTVQTATVQVRSAAGDVERVVLTEESADSRFLSGRIRFATGSAKVGDGILQSPKGQLVHAEYGFGYMATRTSSKQ